MAFSSPLAISLLPVHRPDFFFLNPFISYQLSVISYQLSVISYQLLVLSFKFSDHCLLITENTSSFIIHNS
ncbi:hypothetical protein MICAF_2840006 [Microcystis aeruginosa PCC 9807]|uniref:Uncharacterized protein n=1 Tax=Microcystis aeruginosa PCC 9807 TaxID=1160283 RepID=I4H608_MICAE|nr:hypothetical protein MICAF_2840006 [Microcystis aeruginosa PCC 9807]